MVVLTFCIDKQMPVKKYFQQKFLLFIKVSFDGRNSLWRKVIEFAASVLTMAFTGRKNRNFSSLLKTQKNIQRQGDKEVNKRIKPKIYIYI